MPSRFQPCLTNLPTVKRPFHVGWFCSRVSVLDNICYRQGVIWFHVNAQPWTCVHSQKVVSGIRLCNCFVFTFLDSKYLQTKQLTICYILILFKWKKLLLTVIWHKVLGLGCIIAPWTRLNSVLVHSYIKSLDRFQIQKYIQSISWCLPIAPICDECKFWCHGITSLNVFIHWHVKYISSKQS